MERVAKRYWKKITTVLANGQADGQPDGQADGQADKQANAQADGLLLKMISHHTGRGQGGGAGCYPKT